MSPRPGKQWGVTPIFTEVNTPIDVPLALYEAAENPIRNDVRAIDGL